MKMWWGKFVKDYLTFSKKERTAIFLVIFFSLLIYFGSRFFPIKKTHIDNTAFQKELAELKISIDTGVNSYARNYDDNYEHYRPKSHDDLRRVEGELFLFDPNTLDAAGWKRLGLRDKTITTIHNFIAKGYRFRQPDDIRKIYGLRTKDADRLIPFVKIAEKETFEKSTSKNDYYSSNAKKAETDSRVKLIDINSADTSELIRLPGIGSKLAARIVNFRQKLGGFYSVNQIAETYGVPDSTFQKVKDRLQCKTDGVKKFNINTADANELKTHPYIRWNIANAIVNYRTQHGNYKSVDDVRKIEIITDEQFNKIAPYLVL